MVQCPPMGGLCVKGKQEKAAFWKTFGRAALLWAALAVGFELLFPSSAAAPAGAADILRSCLVLPMAEELAFRGAALRLLQPLGRNAAILGQALLFAALHGSLQAKAYALGMGLIFGWAADRAGSLLPGVLLHILNNGVVLAKCLAERGTP